MQSRSGVPQRSRTGRWITRSLTYRLFALAVLALPVPLLSRAAPAAHAAGLWFVAPSGTDSATCGSSAAQPCKTIGQAIANAGAGDTISIAAGTYHELITIGKNLTLQGAGASTTILDGTGLSGSVITIGTTTGLQDNPPTEPVVSLSGLTVQHGTGTALSALFNVGLIAIATSGGGGILNFGTLSIARCTVGLNSLNVTGQISGVGVGGEAFGAGILTFGTLTVSSSTISNNTIVTTSTGTATSTTVFSAGAGAGIASLPPIALSFTAKPPVQGQPSGPSPVPFSPNLSVSGSTISGNSVSGAANIGAATGITIGAIGEALGGGIFITGTGILGSSSSTYTVTGSTISGNSASATGELAVSAGGGIFSSPLFIGIVPLPSPQGPSAALSPFGLRAGVRPAVTSLFNSTLTVTGSKLTGNKAVATATGVILGPTTVSNAAAAAIGGGIFTEEGAVTVNTSSISGNAATATANGVSSNTTVGTVTAEAVGGGLANVVIPIGPTVPTFAATGDTISGNSVDGEATGPGHDTGFAFGGGVFDGFPEILIIGAAQGTNTPSTVTPSAPTPLIVHTLTNSTISSNTATAKGDSVQGRGLASGGGASIAAFIVPFQMNMTADAITGNSVAGSSSGGLGSGAGGGIMNGFLFGLGAPTNGVPSTSQVRPGVTPDPAPLPASLIVNGSTVSNNSATGSGVEGQVFGGGIDNFNPTNPAMALMNSTVGTNTATATSSNALSGGTLAVGGGVGSVGTVTASNVTIAHNTLTGGTGTSAEVGGGGIGTLSGGAILTNATISANSVIGPTVTPVLAPGSVHANDGIPTRGAGLFGNASLANTIITGNTLNGSVENCDVESTYVDLKGNLEDTSPSTCGLSAANNDVIGQDPQLGPLQDNGSILAGAPGSQTVLFTEAIPLTSPAANAAIAATCKALVGPDGVTTDTDERGLPRHSALRGNCDIGAYDTGDDITLPVAIGGAVNVLYQAGFRLGFAASSGSNFPIAYITLQKGTSSLVAQGGIGIDCPDQCIGTTSIPVPGTVTVTLTGTPRNVQGPLFALGDTVKAILTFTNTRLVPGSSTFRQALVSARVQVFAPGSATPLLDVTTSGPFTPQSRLTAAPAS